MFPNGVPDPGPIPRCIGTSANDYAHHTANLLRCGKVRLRQQVRAAASVFAVGKRGKNAQREVWSGAVVSTAAPRPPRPPRLGNPAVFSRIVKRPGVDLVFAKRDAKAFFDQLALPPGLAAFFGRPGIRAGVLAAAVGCSLAHLRDWIDDLGAGEITSRTLLYPVNTVWPMGFSWSSFIAQSNMVGACIDAGIDESALLCLEAAPPVGAHEWVTVATDDVILIHETSDASRDCTRRLDAALQRRGIERNTAKDVDDARHVEALGCDIGNAPPWVEPALVNFVVGLCACMGLATTGVASPKGFSKLLGLLQWYAQPSRWLFSVFHRAYGFRTLQPELDSRSVPLEVINECLVFLALSPLCSVNLERQILPLVVACDAAPQFGFGVAVKSCEALVVERLAAEATQLDRYLELDGVVAGFEHKAAYGSPVKLRSELGDFTPVLSIKAKRMAHSGELEAHGLLLLTQWLARSASRHSARAVTAIDARAVLGAARKGRTSAATLRRPISRVAATCLAADLQLLCLWVPSAHNPADAPSRGKRARPAGPSVAKVTKALLKQPSFQTLRRQAACWSRLRATGLDR